MVKLGMMTLNGRGAQQRGMFANIVFEFTKWRDARGLNVLVFQEHNMSPDKNDELQRLATSKNIKLVIAFAPDNGSGQHPGGVLMLIDEKTLQYKNTLHNEDGFVMIRAEWGGDNIEIAGVYAPVSNAGTIKADFFKKMKGKITQDTFVGGDWNCVPDVTLDVESSNPLGYRNKGASELAGVCAK